ncbi:MAG TPA: sugar phosphate isomerase/epimerase, partial [Hyphomonadaceae bacterium]|nr:sugar phosphate isomerase/epimerase [Hyphomonadaceae bacterium]
MNQSRRTFLQMLAAAGAISPAAGCQTPGGAPLTSNKPFFQSRNLPIGIQLYTLGDLMTKDPDGTLKEVAKIGYKTVELAGYLGKTPAQLRASFDAAGLTCTSAHVGLAKGTAAEPKLLDDLGRVAADMHVIGATHVICPAMAAPADIKLAPNPGEGFRIITRVAQAMTEDHWKRMAGEFNDIGRKLKAEGIAFGYHNHNMEFVRLGDRTGFDILIAETDPGLVAFELDIGWAAAGGLDPAAMFNRNQGRYFLAHIKDIKASTQPNINVQMDPTEVGAGRLDWKSILPA